MILSELEALMRKIQSPSNFEETIVQDVWCVFCFYHQDLKIGGSDDDDENGSVLMRQIANDMYKKMFAAGFSRDMYQITSSEKGYFELAIKKTALPNMNNNAKTDNRDKS